MVFRITCLVSEPRTMEVQNRAKLVMMTSGDGGDNVKCEEQAVVKSVKRPFDVAFLMLPDEKKPKQPKVVAKCLIEREVAMENCYNNNEEEEEEDEDEEIDIEDTRSCDIKVTHQHHHAKYFTQKQQIFDDPNLIKNKKSYEALRTPPPPPPHLAEQKSAFTKVNLAAKDARVSPSLSLSPDYQTSLSPSPPSRPYNHHHHHHVFPPATLLHHPSSAMQNSQQIFKYQANFMPDGFGVQQQTLDSHFLAKNPDLMPPGFSKLRPPMYRPELAYNYQQFPGNNPDLLKNSPAAAILTSLLPPSLAALSLPGQNVCAKCNITFRMTSDLVYHMRSHHKNESNDPSRRRREDKLKCPVCAESFRERHHLTRHMTAHQDKDDDDREGKKDGL